MAQPNWPGHVSSVASVGASSVSVACDKEGLVDAHALEAARTSRTKAFILANPSNPSGVVHSPERVRAIARWRLAHDIWFITDEVVYHVEQGSALDMTEEYARLIVIDGGSKVHAMTGWRVGWLIAQKR